MQSRDFSLTSSKYVVSHKHKHFVLMLGWDVLCSAMLPPAESIHPPMLSNGDFFAVTIGSGGAAVARAYKHALTHSKQLHIYYWYYQEYIHNCKNTEDRFLTDV